MSGWNYRIVKHTVRGRVYYGLHDCCYKDGEIDGVTGYPVEICTEPDSGESPSERIVSWLRMMTDGVEKHKDDTLDADCCGAKPWVESADSRPYRHPLCVPRRGQFASRQTADAGGQPRHQKGVQSSRTKARHR
jgi:hypothetical protein